MGAKAKEDSQCNNFYVFADQLDVYGYEEFQEPAHATALSNARVRADVPCKLFNTFVVADHVSSASVFFDTQKKKCYLKKTPGNGGTTFFKTSNDFIAIVGAVTDDAPTKNQFLVSPVWMMALANRDANSTAPADMRRCRMASVDFDPPPERSASQPSPSPQQPSPPLSSSTPSDDVAPGATSDFISSALTSLVPSLGQNASQLTVDTAGIPITKTDSSSFITQQRNKTVSLVTSILKTTGNPIITLPAESKTADATPPSMPIGLVVGLGVGAGILLIIAASFINAAASKSKAQKRNSLSASSSSNTIARTPSPDNQEQDYSIQPASSSAGYPSFPPAAVFNNPQFPVASPPEFFYQYPLVEKTSSQVGLPAYPTSANNNFTNPATFNGGKESRPSNMLQQQKKKSSEGLNDAIVIPMPHIHQDLKLPVANTATKVSVKGRLDSTAQTQDNLEILSWTAQDVADALLSAGLSSYYVDLLKEKNVGGYSLLMLDDGSLKGIGVESRSARLLVLTAVDFLRGEQTDQDWLCNQTNNLFNIFGFRPYDIFGYDINSEGVKNVPSICNCASICKDLDGCSFFGYDGSGLVCFTKKMPQNGGITLFKKGDGTGFITLDVALNDDERNQRQAISGGATVSQCRSLCQSNGNCRYASLQGGECRLYKGATIGQIGIALKFSKTASDLPPPQPPSTQNNPPSIPFLQSPNGNITRDSSLPTTTLSLSLPTSQQLSTALVLTTTLSAGPTATATGRASSSYGSNGLPIGLVAGLGGAGSFVLIIVAALLLMLCKRGPKRRNTISGSSVSSSESRLRHQAQRQWRRVNDLSLVPEPAWAPGVPKLHPQSDPSTDLPSQGGTESVDSDFKHDLMPQDLKREPTLTRQNAKIISARESVKVPMMGYSTTSKESQVASKDQFEPRQQTQQQSLHLANSDMLRWTPDEVARELIAAGVSTASVDVLRENNTDGYSLMVLNDGDLKEMGVEPRCARVLVLTAVNLLRGVGDEVVEEDAPPQYN
ncbi:hypothetical protein HDU97_001636 [Phlyctochytrium planicorne]|nr:hypothetical protein HDU97_001636 [Phlyctochytrium planicorne]